MEKGLFELWKNIFQGQASSAKDKESSGNYSTLESEIVSCSQQDKLLEGVYENFNLNMTNDYSFEKTVECLEWFTYSDLVHDERYRSLIPLAIHSKCNSMSPKVSHPQSGYANFIKLKHSQSVIDSFLQSELVPPMVYASLTKTIFVRDFISPFLDILAMPIRSVNPHLYSQKEKQSLNNLVEIMKHYNINYTLENNISHSLQYVLNPPIDNLIQFNFMDKTPSKHLHLSNTQKQIISIAVIQKVNKKEVQEKESKPKEKAETAPAFKVPTPPSTPKPQNIVEHVPKDFFGRPIQLSPESTNKKNIKESTVSKIKYRYQEGFTNAVKKSAYIKDFL
ncbi:AAA ATPase domain-containing protein [Heterostelium album PN500]|uniref:AAA ATPase domain-containing protein n=1 Tax=Heterostelium pallidum (strain ATCC 26659 / Pp 5 / PN500) TaxID=670386 RepID=D3BTX9_HETP5|nr:AAA ATPase domain-containing protein [Heterostelium album PN500]EFA75165.1 AAA ATPase domain-containing protein [Heterostelium album PN500]|eukprot:XP_020427299.1 AAA ATPase domain-containing protein [Heterostelium album PN500]